MHEISRELYKTMYLIRQVEEKIRKHYGEDEMKTPTHLSVGAEAIAVGVLGALDPQDVVFGTYRSHGIYLAKTGETDKFFGELFGRVSGVSRGKAGSMHLASPSHGLMLTSAVVGTTIPVAVGSAFANQYQKKESMVAVFFGDGAIDEGVFWESLNLACLKKLPMIFVCEDNDLAIHTKTADRHGYRSIADIVSQFDCFVVRSESTDVEILYHLTKDAIAQCRVNPRPMFMHLKYYRYYEHVGVNDDFRFGYRGEDEFKTWLARDPLSLQRTRLKTQGLGEEALRGIEQPIEEQIDKSFRAAAAAAFPERDELFHHVYANE